MPHHHSHEHPRVCPPWIGWLLLLNPLRRLVENPKKMLGPHVKKGMTVLEPGPGMGYFTLPMARMVGPKGRVVAIDVSETMLKGLRKRAARARLLDRIELRHNSHPATLGIDDLNGKVDLATAIHVVHEVPDQTLFFRELFMALKPGGRVLMVEPRGPVSLEEFGKSTERAVAVGFECQKFGVRRVFLTKPGGA